jgi:hypothetical protein
MGDNGRTMIGDDNELEPVAEGKMGDFALASRRVLRACGKRRRDKSGNENGGKTYDATVQHRHVLFG